MERDGTAVDAAIAALFCDSLHQSSNMGPGGGFFMTIYQQSTGKVEILNARERAPIKATEDMFKGDPEMSLYSKSIRVSNIEILMSLNFECISLDLRKKV